MSLESKNYCADEGQQQFTLPGWVSCVTPKVMSPMGPRTRNDIAGEGQQWFIRLTWLDWPKLSQEVVAWHASCESEKYDYESFRAQNKEWRCWQGQQQYTQLTNQLRLSHNPVKVVRQENMVIGHAGPKTSKDYAGEGQKQIIRPDQTRPDQTNVLVNSNSK
jgi:hypothetical protein